MDASLASLTPCRAGEGVALWVVLNKRFISITHDPLYLIIINSDPLPALLFSRLFSPSQLFLKFVFCYLFLPSRVHIRSLSWNNSLAYFAIVMSTSNSIANSVQRSSPGPATANSITSSSDTTQTHSALAMVSALSSEDDSGKGRAASHSNDSATPQNGQIRRRRRKLTPQEMAEYSMKRKFGVCDECRRRKVKVKSSTQCDDERLLIFTVRVYRLPTFLPIRNDHYRGLYLE